jgi:Pilus biogenesis CpaD protein (pilus_cpaD)
MIMNRKNIFTILLLSAALAACSKIPKEAYYTRGQPESLIDKTSEVVNLKVESPANVDEITTWINHDQPTRAELKCMAGDSLCNEVTTVLHQFGVPVRYAPSPDNTLALIYERVQARDCENRYIDNTVNPYNLNHPTFGCTISVNMVQMVTDKREFTNPALMDYPDANKTSQALGFYNTPSAYSPPSSSTAFTPIVTQESIQTQGLSGGTSR